MTPHSNRLAETVLIRCHNICFCLADGSNVGSQYLLLFRKIIFELSSIPTPLPLLSGVLLLNENGAFLECQLRKSMPYC